MKYNLDTIVYHKMARKEEMTLKLFTPKNRRQNHLNYTIYDHAIRAFKLLLGHVGDQVFPGYLHAQLAVPVLRADVIEGNQKWLCRAM